MSDDTEQISVAELLKRNGQKVGESRGGRRRRGVPGGISVAELTGEMPVVRDVPHREEKSDPPADDPVEDTTVSARPQLPTRSPASKPGLVPVTSLDDGDDLDEPVASRSSFRAEKKSPSRDSQGAWISHSTTRGRTPTRRPSTEDTTLVEPVASGISNLDEPATDKPATDKPAAKPEKKIQAEPALLSGSFAGELIGGSRRTEDDEATEVRSAPKSIKEKAPTVDEADDNLDDDHDDIDDDLDEPAVDGTREWLVLAGQGLAAVVAGALMFKGFEKLWDTLPWVALILAVLVIVGLVAMVRILRRTEDMISFVIAVVVGMVVTLGPLAFMLTSS